jgi:hypothetical protein
MATTTTFTGMGFGAATTSCPAARQKNKPGIAQSFIARMVNGETSSSSRVAEMN